MRDEKRRDEIGRGTRPRNGQDDPEEQGSAARMTGVGR